jgi:hypothetical protein
MALIRGLELLERRPRVADRRLRQLRKAMRRVVWHGRLPFVPTLAYPLVAEITH